MTSARKTTAIILKRIDFGEADRIVTALTPQGKISLLVKAARRQRSKLASGIELLSENEIGYIEGRGELMTLISSRVIKQWTNLLSDYDRLQMAYELLKNIQRMTDRHTGEEFYETLRTALSALDEPGNSLTLVETWFLLQCLAIGGHKPNLATDQHGSKLDADKRYELDYEHGTLLPVDTGGLDAEHIKLWRVSISNPLDIVLGIRGASEVSIKSSATLKRFVQYQYK